MQTPCRKRVDLGVTAGVDVRVVCRIWWSSTSLQTSGNQYLNYIRVSRQDATCRRLPGRSVCDLLLPTGRRGIYGGVSGDGNRLDMSLRSVSMTGRNKSCNDLTWRDVIMKSGLLCPQMVWLPTVRNKKLRVRYREENRASVVLSCYVTFFRKKIFWWLINHFYVIDHERYRIRPNNVKQWPFKVIQGHWFTRYRCSVWFLMCIVKLVHLYSVCIFCRYCSTAYAMCQWLTALYNK